MTFTPLTEREAVLLKRPTSNAFSAIGQAVIGEAVLHQNIGAGFTIDISNSATRQRTQNGFGQSGRRRYTRGLDLILPAVSEPLRESVQLSIMSQAGALVGQIRTDIQYTILHSLTFSDLEGSSQELTLKLTRLPDFPILPFSIIIVHAVGSKQAWYAGEILYPSERGTPKRNNLYEYKARGFVRYLEQWHGEGVYARAQDIGAIVEKIARENIQNRGAVKYNASKINTSTGALAINDIDIAKHPLKKIFNTFADMTGHVFGVDAEREFFFLPREQRIRKTYFIGYQAQEFSTIENSADVRNVITVQRDKGKGSGGSGWTVAGVFNDATSAKKYGRKELNYQAPGFFSDDDCKLIGEGLLRRLAEPQLGAKASNIIIKTPADFIQRGAYRFVLPYSSYTVNYSAVDQPSEWTREGMGDLTLAHESENFVYADGAVELAFQNAKGDRIYIEKTFYRYGRLNKIQFYVQSNLAGSYLSVGFGLADISEHVFSIDIAAPNQFIPITIDVAALNLREIRKFGFIVTKNTSAPVELQLDKIDLNVSGHKSYVMQYKKASYIFEPRRQVIKAEFGTVQKRLEDYLEGLLATASELRYVSEVR